MTKIILDPIVNIYYAGFYIQGFNELFGEKSIKFETKPFNHFQTKNRISFLNFIIQDNQKKTKYTISFNDSYLVEEELYEWCDVYASVNANFLKTDKKFHSKLVSLVPSFGIRLWDSKRTYIYALKNLLKVIRNVNQRKFIGKYKRMLNLRIPIEEYYTSIDSKSDYVFFLSTLWYNDEWNKNDEGVNKRRANFIQACKSIDGLRFEGGFYSQPNSSIEAFHDCIYTGKMINMKEWIKKTKESMVVFNTPAFWDCHGWKLGEYLALGKAIISTELSNDLPAPLIHGEHIHYVENDFEKIKDAILYLKNNTKYREKLEAGAKNYWNTYGTPLKSLEIIELHKSLK